MYRDNFTVIKIFYYILRNLTSNREEYIKLLVYILKALWVRIM